MRRRRRSVGPCASSAPDAEQKVNWLTHDVGDPLIGTPEYKVSAVRVETLASSGD